MMHPVDRLAKGCRVQEITATADRQVVTVRGPGGSAEITVVIGRAGRLEVEVWGNGDCAVWVQTDLVLGGED